MTASQGRGQQVLGHKGGSGFGWHARAGALGLVLGIASGGGAARACHLHHEAHPATSESKSTPAVQAAELLNPTSLVPTLTPTSAPLPTVMPASPVPVLSPPSAILNPIPVAAPPAADQIMPAAPAVSSYSPGTMPTCTCTCPPPSAPPVAPPPASSTSGGSPGASANLQPPASTTTPEPSTILSALAMISAVVIARRRRAGV